MSADGSIRMLVLGASGMLGSTIFRYFSSLSGFETYGTVRNVRDIGYFAEDLRPNLFPGINVETESGLIHAFSSARPTIVVNCVGIIKQLPAASDHIDSLAINALLPHRLARMASLSNSRVIHFSTDCVFSGKVGRYSEGDSPDAYDLYGRSKLLGEIDYENAVTLRTSIIGHELASSKSLLEWFLAQREPVRGFTKAVFSGLPTIEVARVLRDHIIPYPELRGLYHLSVDPIDKDALLRLVADVYGKSIPIEPDDKLVIDRSLDSSRLQQETGFRPKPWTQLVREMHVDFVSTFQDRAVSN